MCGRQCRWVVVLVVVLAAGCGKREDGASADAPAPATEDRANTPDDSAVVPVDDGEDVSTHVPPFSPPKTRADGIAGLIAVAEGEYGESNARSTAQVYAFVRLFDPQNEKLRAADEAIPRWVSGEDRLKRVRSMSKRIREIIKSTSSVEDLQSWDATVDEETELQEIGLLLDRALVGNLDFVLATFNDGNDQPTEMAIFLPKPTLTMEQIVSRHGQPSTQVTRENGALTYTYGRFRVVGTGEGRAAHVSFVPFEAAAKWRP